jgi:WD40 repeat protein
MRFTIVTVALTCTALAGPTQARPSFADTRVLAPELVVQVGHVYPIQAVAFSPDAKTVITGGWDNTAILWDARTGRELRRLPGHRATVASVAFLPSGHAALTMGWTDFGGAPVPVRLWELTNGHLICEHHFPDKSASTFARVLPNGDIGVLVGHLNEGFMDYAIWNSSKAVQLMKHNSLLDLGVCSHFSLSAEGAIAAVGGFMNTAVWDVKHQHELQLSPTLETVQALALSRNGRLLFAAFEHGGVIHALRFQDKGIDIDSTHSLKPSIPHPLDAAFSPDSQTLATAHADGGLRIWNTNTGTLIGECHGHTDCVLAVAFSADGRQVVTGSADRTARIWDVSSRRCLITLGSKAHYVQTVGFAGRGDHLITSDWNGRTAAWELGTRHVEELKGTPPFIATAIDNCSNGKLLLLEDTSIPSGTLMRAFANGREGTRFFTSQRRPAPMPPPHLTSPTADRFLAEHVFPADARLGSTPAQVSPDFLVVDANGKIVQRLRGARREGAAATCGNCTNIALTGGNNGLVFLWNIENGRQMRRYEVGRPVESLAFAPDDHTFAIAGSKGAESWDIATGQRRLTLLSEAVDVVTFAPGGKYVGCWTRNAFVLVSAETGAITWRMTVDARVAEEHPAGQLLSLSYFGGGSSRKAPSVAEPRLNRSVAPIAYTSDGESFATTNDHNWIGVIESNGKGRPKVYVGHTAPIQTLAIAPAGGLLASGGWDGTTRLWSLKRGTALATLVSLADGTWFVRTDSGRFDTNELDTIAGMHWLFSDDPFHPLPPECFLRDYYEPRLLSRVLAEEKFAPIRSLVDLNRVQPQVALTSDQGHLASGIARIKVTVAGAKGHYQRDGRGVTTKTDVYDLRVFRDGQLVGQWPRPRDGSDGVLEPDPTSAADMQRWRAANRINPEGDRVERGSGGKLSLSFAVRLPSRSVEGPVELTAYAFNEDRVKSETARFTFKAPVNLLKGRPRAYLIGFGVSTSQNPAWNLKFADADAKLTVAEFAKALNDRYEVVPVELVSEGVDGRLTGAATRENLRSVLQLLAGQKVSGESRKRIPNGERLGEATPDDVVLLALSCHGYTDQRGTLYLLPYDVGQKQCDIRTALPRCISSADLSAWLRGIDAGELAMTLDACHSAAAGAPPGFKPGPFGGRGLAQLAYDKGMRVLAASQAKDVALECESIQHGLLTYALVREGLQNRQAVRDGKLTLRGLLSYAADRVPELYEEIIHHEGGLEDIRGRQVVPIKPADNERSRAQKPELFDYSRKRSDLTLVPK